ncbi:MAG TPA: hypothetical protein VMB81_18965 [Candidatus Sulfotelmatobacter sp.]|nr:hypothetical protein [Candidatus Sulfotelmatobacter sp.]
MTFPVRPSLVLVAAGLALSGCIDIECPAEFDRPISRERFCGHTGDVGTATPYKQFGNTASVPGASIATPSTTRFAPPPPSPMVQAAPPGPVTVQPVPPPAGAPTQIR